MTYGNASLNIVDETIKPQPTVDFVRQRAAFENHVLESGVSTSHVRTVFVRPGFVYGRSGGPVANKYFGIDKEGSLSLYGSPTKRWSWVHVDDLGDAYVLIAKTSGLSGELFNLSNTDYPTYEELRFAMAKASGWVKENGKFEWKEVPKDDIGLNVYENTVMVNNAKARDILGWNPKRFNFLSEVDIYYQSWKASKDLKIN